MASNQSNNEVEIGVVLSEDQKEIIIKCWNDGETDIKKIILAVWGRGIDTRSKKGLAVKKFLKETNLEARPEAVFTAPAELELTDVQKEIVADNVEKMSVIDIAKLIFSNTSLSLDSKEVQAVTKFHAQIAKAKAAEIEAYHPPKTKRQGTELVRKYVNKTLSDENITPRFLEGIDKMIGHMGTYRFIHEANNLRSETEQTMFEETFVRLTYDKPDLTQEDVDAYIGYCYDVISFERMKNEETALIEEADRSREENDGKINMAIVEAIKNLRTTMTQNKTRMSKALENLNGSRSKRLEELNQSNASILTLIDAFRDADKRKKFLAKVREHNGKVKDVADELTGMDSLYFELFGASRPELLL